MITRLLIIITHKQDKINTIDISANPLYNNHHCILICGIINTGDVIMKKLSETEKENIVKRCLSGEGITVLANEYGISRGSIYNWINKFKIQKKVKVNIGEFRKLS